MAKLSFIQGIVQYGNSPFFLQRNGNDVDIIAVPNKTVIAFADGKDKNYLYSESYSISSAWKDVFTGDNWLYWEIDRITGIRTFGYTSLKPSYFNKPENPDVGQMWFDTNPNIMTMYEWNGSRWVRVIRVLAARYTGGVFYSPIDGTSIESNFVGTQIGTSGDKSGNDVFVGSLLFDTNGKPISSQNGKFFTTEDYAISGVPVGSSIKFNSLVTKAEAAESIPKYSVVELVDYNTVRPSSIVTTINKIIGVIEEDVATNEITQITFNGYITNSLWDFTDSIGNPNMSGAVGNPIYVGINGVLTTSQPTNGIPVGAIINNNTILFSPGLYGTNSGSSSGGVVDHGSLLGLNDDDHPQYLKITGGTMTGSLVLNSDPTADLQATTKQYVDAVANGLDVKESVDVSTLSPLTGAVYTPTGGTGSTGSFTNVDLTNIDGSLGTDYFLINGNRILVKNQTDPKQNGIYVVVDMSNPSMSTLERSPDQDGSDIAEVSPGNFTFTSGGANNVGTGWTILSGTATGPNNTIVLNVDDIIWTKVSNVTAYSAGDNIIIDGTNTISVRNADNSGTVNALKWNSQDNTVSNPMLNHVLVYDDTSSRWKNSYLTIIRNQLNTSLVQITPQDSVSVISANELNITTTNNVNISSSNGAILLNSSSSITSTSSTNNTLLTTGAGHINLNSANNINFTANIVSVDSNRLVLNSSGSPLQSTEIEFNIFGNAFSSKILASSNPTENVIFTIPSNNGNSGYILTTDGNGITSWNIPNSGNSIIDSTGKAFVSAGGSVNSPLEDGKVGVSIATSGKFISVDPYYGNIDHGSNINISASNLTSSTYYNYGGNIKISAGNIVEPVSSNHDAGLVNISSGGRMVSAGSPSITTTLSGASLEMQGVSNDAAKSGNIKLEAGDVNMFDAGNIDIFSKNVGNIKIHTGSVGLNSNLHGGDIDIFSDSMYGSNITIGNISARTHGEFGTSVRIVSTGGRSAGDVLINADSSRPETGSASYHTGNITLSISESNIDGSISGDISGGDILLSPDTRIGTDGVNINATLGNIIIESTSGDVNRPMTELRFIERVTGNTPKRFTSFRGAHSPSGSICLIMPQSTATTNQQINISGVTTSGGVDYLQMGFTDEYYEIPISIIGTPVDGSIVLMQSINRNLIINETGHNAIAISAPVSASATFDVYVNNSSVTSGIITFTVGSNTATFSNFPVGGIVLTPGDYIVVKCTVANSISDIGITLSGKYI